MENLTIYSVELINFMCHRHLLVNFKKNITCIGGRNGSGKSAVMIAIGIVLGQRAVSLERGNSYKSLIKSGEHTSVIKIKLRNKCNFKPNFFGEFIYVERKLRRDGNNLSILNEKKKIFSSKKEDLDYILDLLSLKLTNPLNFLTQENSKKFLNVTKKESLYDFFLKGTEIEDTKYLHDEAKIEANTMKEKIENLESEIKEIDTCIKKEQTKIKMLEETKKMKNRIEELEIEREFSKIDNTKEVELISAEIISLEEELEQLTAKNIELMRQIEEYNKKIQKLRNDEAKERQQKENRLNELDLNIREEEKKIKEIDNDLQGINIEIKEKENKIKRNKKLKGLEDKDFEEELKILKENIKENEKNIINIQEMITENKNKVKIEEKEINEINDRKFFLEKQINYYRKMEKDKMLYFHEHITQILNEIRNSNFKDKVIGPIGLEIDLKENKWYKPISIILRNIISNFIVFNQSDRFMLSKIFSKYKAKFSILTASSKNKIDFYRNKEYKTVVDVLNVKNDIVMNQLIILLNIEQVLLIENRTDAYSVIRKNIKNVDCAYTIDGDKIKIINGGMTDYRHRNLDRHFFESTKNKLEETTQEYENICKKDIKSSKIYLNELEIKKESLNIKNDKLKRKTVELQQIIEDLKEDEDNEVEEERDLLKAQQEELEAILLESRNLISSYSKEMNIIRNKENKRLEIENMNDIHIQRNVITNKIMSIQSKVELKRNKITDLIINYSMAKEKLLQKYKNIKDTLPRNLDEIELDIIKLKTQLEESNKIGNEKILKSEIEDFKKEREKKEEIILKYRNKIEEMIKYVEMRSNKRNELLLKISEEASERFRIFTSQRNYIGNLTFDHKSSFIDLNMKIEEKGSGTKGTLSGGERSFAAICFLLSLWPSVVCPVKILDEFDVFMDNVNRNCTLKLLLDYFINNKEQVILITPLNVKELINENCDVIFLDHGINKE